MIQINLLSIDFRFSASVTLVGRGDLGYEVVGRAVTQFFDTAWEAMEFIYFLVDEEVAEMEAIMADLEREEEDPFHPSWEDSAFLAGEDLGEIDPEWLKNAIIEVANEGLIQ